MLCNNIFVKKEIDSELVEEFVAKRKRSVCNRMCSMCKFEVAGGAHIETFTKEYPILNRCTEYDCLARRTMQQIVVRVNSPLMSDSSEQVCVRVSIPAYVSLIRVDVKSGTILEIH